MTFICSIIIVLLSFHTFASEESIKTIDKNISYIQILQKPNDLNLNLKYARQQGKAGNHKQTIATLERLIMLYPDNAEIKLYLLSVLVQADSTLKATELIQDIKKLSGLSSEDLATVSETEEYLNEENEPKLWNFYADLSIGGIYSENVNSVSKTGKKSLTDDVVDFGSAKYDHTINEGLGLTATRSIGDVSSLIMNINGSVSRQGEETTDDFNSLGFMFAFDTSFGDHGISPYIMFSETENKTAAENHSFMYGFSNYFPIRGFEEHSLNYGYTYADAKNNHNSSYPSTNDTNSKSHNYSFGHDYTLNKKFSTSLNFAYGDSNAKDDTNDFENYDMGLRLNFSLPMAYVSVGNSLSQNDYKTKDSSINSNILRSDLTNTFDVIATKAIGDFFPKVDPNRSFFLSVSYENLISESNILNYDYKTNSMSVGLTKSLHLNK